MKNQFCDQRVVPYAGSTVRNHFVAQLFNETEMSKYKTIEFIHAWFVHMYVCVFVHVHTQIRTIQEQCVCVVNHIYILD